MKKIEHNKNGKFSFLIIGLLLMASLFLFVSSVNRQNAYATGASKDASAEADASKEAASDASTEAVVDTSTKGAEETPTTEPADTSQKTSGETPTETSTKTSEEKATEESKKASTDPKEEQPTESSENKSSGSYKYVSTGVIDPIDDIPNGVELSVIANKVNSIKTVTISVENTTSGEVKDWPASISWNAAPDKPYDKDDTEEQYLTWTGYLDATVKYGEDSVSIPDEDREVSVDVTVAGKTSYSYSYVGTVSVDEIPPFDNGTSVKSIKQELDANYTDVGIIVEDDLGNIDIWYEDDAVVWDSKNQGTYDPELETEQTFSWQGTLKLGKYEDDEGNSVTVTSADDRTVVAKIVVSSDVEYADIEPGTMSGDYDDEDFGKIKTTINESKVKKILEAQTDKTLLKIIADAIAEGKSLSIAVDVETLEESDVDDNIIEEFKDHADAKLGRICDIKLYLMVGGKIKKEKSYQIKSPGTTLTFTQTIPSSIKRSSSSSNGKTYKRKYREYRYHSGDVHSCDEDWTDGSSVEKVTFKSKEFSYYALMYKDEESSSSSSSSSRTSSVYNSSFYRGSSALTGTGTGTGGGTGTGSGAPKTGDEFNAKMWIYFFVVGIVVALCAFILYQDTKDWRDEKKEAEY